MLRRIFLMCLTFAVWATSSFANEPLRIDAGDDLIERPGCVLPAFESTWEGGPCSLPYNTMKTWQELRDHALTIDAVRAAMATFEARGYIRRSDTDTAMTVVGSSSVILGYQRPGVDVAVEQPIIEVNSQAVFVLFRGIAGYTPISMVIGHSVADSSGVPIYYEAPGEHPVAVVQMASPDVDPAMVRDGVLVSVGPMTAGREYAPDAYSAAELLRAVVQAYTCWNNGAVDTWVRGWGAAVGNGMLRDGMGGATVGALSRTWAGVGIGAAGGVVVGFCAEHYNYTKQHPYPGY